MTAAVNGAGARAMSPRSVLSINVPRPMDPDGILDELNSVKVAVQDKPEQYAMLRDQHALPNSYVLRLINSLQVEGFIPANIAVLIKNNWHDVNTISPLLRGIIVDLRDNRKLISERLATYLLARVDQPDNTAVVQLLTVCMRYHEREDLYSLDELVTFSSGTIEDFIRTKELLHSKIYLEHKLARMAEQFPNTRATLTLLLNNLRENNPADFKANFIRFLDVILQAQPDGIKKFCFEDLKEMVMGLSEDGLFVALSQAFKTQDFYGDYLVRVTDLTRSLTGLEQHQLAPLAHRCERAFQHALYVLADFKNMPKASYTAYCLHHGLVRQEWLKINALFEGKKHHFCNCHAVKDPKKPDESRQRLWPLHQEVFAPIKHSHGHANVPQNVAVIGCNWGSGHKHTTLNISTILEEEGMHPISLDFPDDVLASEDSIRKSGLLSWLGWSVTKIFNEFLMRKAFSGINLLRWMAGTDYLRETDAPVVKKVAQRLLLTAPAAVINTYSDHNEPVIRAASYLGIPAMHVNTDVSRKIFARTAPPAYNHFKMALPFSEEVMFPRVSTTERPDQIAVLGPPIKKAYDRVYTEADIAEAKRELATELGIIVPPGKKLIVVSSGSNGTVSPAPDLIAKKYAGKPASEIPFVLVVLCGANNDAYFNHVSSIAAPFPPGTIKPCRLVAPEMMEKLNRVASFGGGVIGKAGGLTVFELAKCGTRLIVDSIPYKITASKDVFWDVLVGIFNWVAGWMGFENILPWEKVNQDFVATQGLGATVKTDAEFYTALDQMLQHTRPVTLRTPVYNFSERLPATIREMQDRARADATLQGRCSYIKNPAEAVGII